MRAWSWRMVCAAAVVGAGVMHGPQAAAQSYGDSSPSLAPSPGYQSPVSIPLFAPAIPNPLADPTASSSGSSSTNIFNNPLAAPLIYNSMLSASMPMGSLGTSTASTSTASTSTASASTASTSTANAYRGMGGMGGMNQLGMMMLLSSQMNGGAGSGELSGVRSDPRKLAASAQEGTMSRSPASSRPGGLASRYFRRSGGQSAYPQNYFNRRPRYFP